MAYLVVIPQGPKAPYSRLWLQQMLLVMQVSPAMLAARTIEANALCEVRAHGWSCNLPIGLEANRPHQDPKRATSSTCMPQPWILKVQMFRMLALTSRTHGFGNRQPWVSSGCCWIGSGFGANEPVPFRVWVGELLLISRRCAPRILEC